MKRFALIVALAVALASQPVAAQVQCVGAGCIKVVTLCSTAPATTTTGTTEEILATCLIPSEVNVPGLKLEITWIGHTTANNNIKTTRVRFNNASGEIIMATTNQDGTAAAQNNQVEWGIQAQVWRSSATTAITGGNSFRQAAGGTGAGAAFTGGSTATRIGVSVTWATVTSVVITSTTAVAAGGYTLDMFTVTAVIP
jgi:hypothetical protein